MSSSTSTAKAHCFPSETEKQDEFETIFVRSYRNKWGKLMVAAQFGLKAFALRVRKRS